MDALRAQFYLARMESSFPSNVIYKLICHLQFLGRVAKRLCPAAGGQRRADGGSRCRWGIRGELIQNRVLWKHSRTYGFALRCRWPKKRRIWNCHEIEFVSLWQIDYHQNISGWIFPLNFSVGCRENVSPFWARFRTIFLYFVGHFCVLKRRAEFIVGLYHFVIWCVKLTRWQDRLLVNILLKEIRHVVLNGKKKTRTFQLKLIRKRVFPTFISIPINLRMVCVLKQMAPRRPRGATTASRPEDYTFFHHLCRLGLLIFIELSSLFAVLNARSNSFYLNK